MANFTHRPQWVVCVLGLVLITALSLPMQGLSTAVWLILLGHYANESWLKEWVLPLGWFLLVVIIIH